MATFTVGRTGFTSLDNNYNGLPVRVWGTTGTTTNVSITLTGLSHTWPDDLDLVLIGPGNKNLVFMSDAGGNFNFPISNVNLTFFDGAAQALPDNAQIAAGSYRPSDFDSGVDFDGLNFGVALNHAAPTGTSTFASAFNGASPNGAWTLGASDDAAANSGTLSTFTITVTTSSDKVVLDDPVFFTGDGPDVIIVSSTGVGSGTYTYNGHSLVTFSGVSKFILDGHAGDDILKGGNGDDTLLGGSGKDKLIGDAGKDTLTGGKGADVLRGGTDKDFFDFNTIRESRPGINRDKIIDFKHGQHDKIDLKSIDAKTGVGGNQKFKFIAKQDFHDLKGELRYKDLGSKVIVQGDVNGDGHADFEIFVKVGLLHKGDFIL